MHVCWYVSQYYRLHNELKGLRLRRGIVLISFGVVKDPVIVNSKNNVYTKRIYINSPKEPRQHWPVLKMVLPQEKIFEMSRKKHVPPLNNCT